MTKNNAWEEGKDGVRRKPDAGPSEPTIDWVPRLPNGCPLKWSESAGGWVPDVITWQEELAAGKEGLWQKRKKARGA